uniref:Uncharacterized protein n=1 Tax=Anguilla anguilla TaxID=7936 RepID=A0A0E9UCG7_ANGAN
MNSILIGIFSLKSNLGAYSTLQVLPFTVFNSI